MDFDHCVKVNGKVVSNGIITASNTKQAHWKLNIALAKKGFELADAQIWVSVNNTRL